MPEPTLQPQPTLKAPVGMAKTAIPIAETPPITPIEMPPKAQTTLTSPHWEGIPTDVIRYFVGENFGALSTKTVELLRDINNWSKQGLAEDTISGRLQKIRGLELKLGAPGIHESKIDRMWNYCRMDAHINELRNRQKAFER